MLESLEVMEQNAVKKGAEIIELRRQISEYARELGFDLCGFSKAKIEDRYLQVFKEWLAAGEHADMGYMEKINQRQNLEEVLPGARSVVVLAVNYNREQDDLKRGHGRVARYAYGRDYHKVIGGMLKKLEKFICELGCRGLPRCKSYVDTGPVMERALAEQAGLGQIGKNGCLITKEFGSWVFLSEIITTLDLNEPLSGAKSVHLRTSPKLPHVCGNCTKCITACPTGAIIRPGVIDARLCISYLTIENRHEIPPHLAEKIKETKRIFGCDICQEVCPHNVAKAKPLSSAGLTDAVNENLAGDQLSTKEIAKINTALNPDGAFLARFAGSPIMRAKRAGLTRNLKILE